jgi:hypothetical protein
VLQRSLKVEIAEPPESYALRRVSFAVLGLSMQGVRITGEGLPAAVEEVVEGVDEVCVDIVLEVCVGCV